MNKKGFSYAEAMVTMLIVAIIMVATTPIITKKAHTNKGQIWSWTNNGQGASTFFGTGGMQRVIIGANNVEDESARLIVYNADDNRESGVKDVTLPPIVKFFNLSNSNSKEIGRIVTTETSLGLGKEALQSAQGSIADNLHATAIGSGALNKMTMGQKNTAIGYNACKNIIEGEGNICIGANSGPDNDVSNQLFIDSGDDTTNNPLIHGDFGNNIITINGRLMINDNNYGEYNVAETLSFLSGASDSRLKNIKGKSTAGLKEINQLQIKNFTFKKDKQKTPHVGVIAQELQKVFPNSVFKAESGYLHILKEEMFYAMINAIKELDIKFNKSNDKIKKMEQEITVLQDENSKLMKKLEELEQKMSK